MYLIISLILSLIFFPILSSTDFQCEQCFIDGDFKSFVSLFCRDNEKDEFVKYFDLFSYKLSKFSENKKNCEHQRLLNDGLSSLEVKYNFLYKKFLFLQQQKKIKNDVFLIWLGMKEDFKKFKANQAIGKKITSFISKTKKKFKKLSRSIKNLSK